MKKLIVAIALIASMSSAYADSSDAEVFDKRATKAYETFKECFTGKDEGTANKCLTKCENTMDTLYRYTLDKTYPKVSYQKVFETNIYTLKVRYSPSNHTFQCVDY